MFPTLKFDDESIMYSQAILMEEILKLANEQEKFSVICLLTFLLSLYIFTHYLRGVMYCTDCRIYTGNYIRECHLTVNSLVRNKHGIHIITK